VIDRLIDRPTDWPIYWSTDWLIYWSSDWLIYWSTDWLTNWSTDLLIDWFAGCLIDWLTKCLVGWLSGWLTDRVTDCVIDCLAGWLADWLKSVEMNHCCEVSILSGTQGFYRLLCNPLYSLLYIERTECSLSCCFGMQLTRFAAHILSQQELSSQLMLHAVSKTAFNGLCACKQHVLCFTFSGKMSQHPYAACIQLCPPEDEYLMLETCRGE